MRWAGARGSERSRTPKQLGKRTAKRALPIWCPSATWRRDLDQFAFRGQSPDEREVFVLTRSLPGPVAYDSHSDSLQLGGLELDGLDLEKEACSLPDGSALREFFG